MSVQTTHFLQPPRKCIDIEFENIICTVPNGRKGKKQVIRGVTGKFKSGELTAIMGPSGAGKTTLLNILTGFQSIGMKGTIRSSSNNSQIKLGSSQYKKESCYILQDDRLNPLFTVNETMTMAADLKLGDSISPKAKQMLIDDVLETLGLMSSKGTRCQMLSGGQKKRLSIALELLDNPPIMFLDEPTTGLDSSSSLQCVSMLKNLALGGRTIICTIHQPSATIYEMFDHVYVLAEGKCVYQGASPNTVEYLASVGLYCPQYHNPADFLLEVTAGDYGNFTDLLAKAAEENGWRKPVHPPKMVTEEIQVTNTNHQIHTNYERPSEFQKFWILFGRSMLQIYRDWTISHLKVVLHMLVGIFLGLTYYKAGNDGSKTISNVGFLLVTAVYLAYTSLMPAILKFPSELAVLKKERFNNWYRLKTYYFAFLAADIPIQVLFAIAYCTCSYLLSAQPREWCRFLMFLWICILITLTASSFGLVIGTTVNPVNGTFLGAVGIAIMIVVAGFLIIFTHMSKPMYMLTYISSLSYATEALVQAIYGFDRAPLPCPDDVMYCHYRFPEMVLKDFGMDKQTYWKDVAFLLCNFIVLRIIAFCTLKRKLST